MDYKTCPSLAGDVLRQARAARRQAVSLGKARRRLSAAHLARGGARRSRRWRAACARLASQRGDRVALVAENRPEWVIADLAIMSAGAITVPAYTTNTVEDHRHILGNSGARAAIVSTAALAPRVMPAAEQVADVEHVIAIEPLTGGQRPRTPTCIPGTRCWRAARRSRRRSPMPARGRSQPRRHRLPHLHLGHRRRAERRDAEPPQHHRPIAAAPIACSDSSGSATRCSSASCRCRIPTSTPPGMMFPISIGAEIYFAEGAETLAANLLEARADDHDRGAAALRDDAPAHPRSASSASAASSEAVRSGRRDRPQAPDDDPSSLTLADRLLDPRARQAGARQGAGPLRRPAQGDGVGRRAAQPRDRRLLSSRSASTCCRATARPRRRR